MKFRRRTLLDWLAATSAASLASRFAWAQSFPTRPITIVVPFPAGGPTDTLGRVLADRMKNTLGQSVIIENLTGAGGTIGSRGVQPIAVAFDGNGTLLVQTREPAGLSFVDVASHAVTSTLPLSTVSREDTGHDVFHTQAGALIACASCHPEGRDDGHVWLLDGARLYPAQPAQRLRKVPVRARVILRPTRPSRAPVEHLPEAPVTSAPQ